MLLVPISERQPRPSVRDLRSLARVACVGFASFVLNAAFGLSDGFPSTMFGTFKSCLMIRSGGEFGWMIVW